MNAQRMTISLPPALSAQLAAFSQKTGKSKSEIVRDALREFLATVGYGPTCYDVALKAGVIGCFSSGIGDLSTNPRHMEGFGESRTQ